jgi:hypothetical protein
MVSAFSASTPCARSPTPEPIGPTRGIEHLEAVLLEQDDQRAQAIGPDMLVIDRVELKILQHVEKVVIFDHDDAALADKPLHAENGFSQGGHVSEDVGRRDERRVSMRGDDVAGALLVEERLNGFDAVVLGDGGNVGRLDAEHTRAGIFEPREQGAVVRSDVHDEICGADDGNVRAMAEDTQSVTSMKGRCRVGEGPCAHGEHPAAIDPQRLSLLVDRMSSRKDRA